MNNKIKWRIILPVSAGVLVIIMLLNREENIHDLSLNIENDTVLGSDLFEPDKIENKNDSQSPDGYHVVKEPEDQKNNEFQDSYEAVSLVDWVNQIDDVVSSQILDEDSKTKKIINWLNESNTPNEIRVKLYRALVQLKPIDYITEIFSLIEQENNPSIKLAGIEALALTGKQLIVSGYAEGQLILNLLKGAGQQNQEPVISEKLNSLVAYMEGVLAGNKNELIEIEYLTGKDTYVWDLSAKLGSSGSVKKGLSQLLDDVSVLVDQDKALLNEEYSKLNLAYLDYFANGFNSDVPGHQDMGHFFEKIKPQNIETLTDNAVLRYRIWFTAYSYSYSYSSERGSSDYNDFILNELRLTESPVAALVLVESGLNIVEQLDLPTREKLVSLLEEHDVTAQGVLSEEVTEVVSFLVQ
ncbi:MAG: hypothetical protein L3J98_02845 [Gammaproteobacteria bacterium]|nr:hypothetical protein [Gammaproteobacteria bacterium]